MLIETLSVFPEMFDSYMSSSILKRAQDCGALSFKAHNLRDWAHDKRRNTDDEIYGGGQGLLMTCPPIFEAVQDLSSLAHHVSSPVPSASSPESSTSPSNPQDNSPNPQATKPKVIFFTPTGKQFCQADAIELSECEHLLMVCGRYEGIDERAYTLADFCFSIGDYILTGGELAAMVVTDAITRLLPGVLGDEGSAAEESFSESLLEFPQYSRPAEYNGMRVPEILLSGNHAAIDAWRREQSIKRTYELRPDLLETAALNSEDIETLSKIIEQNNQHNL